jgi:hypothetical protein
MKVKFFYRDGNNYKCTWIQEVDDEYWNDFLTKMQNDEESIDDYLDKNRRSDNLFEIYDFGLNMGDIPLIGEYGEGDMDHPYVSIIEYGEDLV